MTMSWSYLRPSISIDPKVSSRALIRLASLAFYDRSPRGRCDRTGRDQAIADAMYSAPVDGRSMIGRDGM